MKRLIVLQHLERESPGLFTTLAEERGLKSEIFRLDKGCSLPALEKEDLLLVLGGPMGIRDLENTNYFWMKQELELIKNALKNKIGIIGICLGAQLLAYAAGGEVETLLAKSSNNPLPEVGWGEIHFLHKRGIGSEPWIPFHIDPLHVLHWHGDRIILPDSAELIASSYRCKEQFFQISPLAFGLQFHIEIDDEMVSTWIDQDHEFIKLGLGVNADYILKNQQKEFGNKTLSNRTQLIRTLFDLIQAQ